MQGNGASSRLPAMSPLPSEGPSGHGFPMRLVDRVETHEAGTVTVTCGVTADGFLQADRVDPSHPWPTALVIEALTQAALPIAGGDMKSVAADSGPPGWLAAIDDFRLHAPVHTGDRLTITARIVATHGGLIRVACRAAIAGGGGEIVAEGEMTIAVGPR